MRMGFKGFFFLDSADRPAYDPVMSEFRSAAGLTGTS
jgi:hypothetical protein